MPHVVTPREQIFPQKKEPEISTEKIICPQPQLMKYLSLPYDELEKIYQQNIGSYIDSLEQERIDETSLINDLFQPDILTLKEKREDLAKKIEDSQENIQNQNNTELDGSLDELKIKLKEIDKQLRSINLYKQEEFGKIRVRLDEMKKSHYDIYDLDELEKAYNIANIKRQAWEINEKPELYSTNQFIDNFTIGPIYLGRCVSSFGTKKGSRVDLFKYNLSLSEHEEKIKKNSHKITIAEFDRQNSKWIWSESFADTISEEEVILANSIVNKIPRSENHLVILKYEEEREAKKLNNAYETAERAWQFKLKSQEESDKKIRAYQNLPEIRGIRESIAEDWFKKYWPYDKNKYFDGSEYAEPVDIPNSNKIKFVRIKNYSNVGAQRRWYPEKRSPGEGRGCWFWAVDEAHLPYFATDYPDLEIINLDADILENKGIKVYATEWGKLDNFIRSSCNPVSPDTHIYNPQDHVTKYKIELSPVMHMADYLGFSSSDDSCEYKAYINNYPTALWVDIPYSAIEKVPYSLLGETKNLDAQISGT
jgi:hypothetical protein